MYRRCLAAAAAASALLLAACSSSPATSTSAGAPAGKVTLDLHDLPHPRPDGEASGRRRSPPRSRRSPASRSSRSSTRRPTVTPTPRRCCSPGQFPDLLQSITPSLYTSAGLLTPFPSSWISSNFILPNDIKGSDYIPPTNSQIIPLVYYNKALFAKAGVTPPTTWARVHGRLREAKGARHRPDRTRRPRLVRRGDAADRRAERRRPRLGPELDPAALRRHGQVLRPERGRGRHEDADAGDGRVLRAGRAERQLRQFDHSTSTRARPPCTRWAAGTWARSRRASGATSACSPGRPTTDPWSFPFSLGGSMAVSSKAPDQAAAFKFAESWSLNPDNLKSLISGDGAFPMLKGKSLASYGLLAQPGVQLLLLLRHRTPTPRSAP